MEPVGTILFLLLAVVMSGKIARLTRHASAFPSAVQWHIFPAYLTVRMAVLMSSASVCGCSAAAKCPPAGMGVHR